MTLSALSSPPMSSSDPFGYWKPAGLEFRPAERAHPEVPRAEHAFLVGDEGGGGQVLLHLAQHDAAHAGVLERGKVETPEAAVRLAGAGWAARR
jgi:hypothetical protein